MSDEPFELEMSDGLKGVAKEFKDKLSPVQIRRALVNALSASLTLNKQAMVRAAKASHNIPRQKLLDGYSQKRPRATTDVITASQAYKSAPIELKHFLTSKKPVTTFIKSSKQFDKAFVVQSIGGHVFEATDERRAPSKGLYAGRIVTRGENKGARLERNVIKKLYTTTTARIAMDNSQEVLTKLKLEDIFKQKLEQQVEKAIRAKK